MHQTTFLQRTIFVLLSVIVWVAITPTTAFAWRSDGVPLYAGMPRTLRVFMVAPATPTSPTTTTTTHAAEAMRAINASGARVRLVRTFNRRAAHITLTRFDTSDRTCSGETNYRVSDSISGGIVTRHPRGPSVIDMWVGGCDGMLETTRLLTHELGHALGLTHEPTRCATMNTTLIDAVPDRCDITLENNQYYCRLLEADDVRGLVARWGGVVRPLTQRICTFTPPPGPTDVAVTYSGTTRSDWRAQISYTAPMAPAINVINAMGSWDECKGPDEIGNWQSFPVPFVPGAAASFDVTYEFGPGRECVTLVARDRWNQSSTPIYVHIDFPELPEV